MVENDSAVEDISNASDSTEASSREPLSEDEAANDEYQNDEYHYDEYEPDDHITTGQPNGPDEDEDEEEEEDEDDESTPHVGSETSKTQSPSSVGNIRQTVE